MLKLLGALCVMAGAGCWGLSAVDALGRRARALEELRAGLAWLGEELTFRLTPLPELLERLGESRGGEVGSFFRDTADLLGQDPEGGLYQSWRQAMVRRLPMLRQEERQVLLEMGRTLGRYDARTQGQALERCVERLAAFREDAREEARRLGKVYAAVSLAGGAAVVLVLV